MIGSSPLTRGKPVADPHLPECDRLIPAHAGKTLQDARRSGDRGLIPAHAGKTDSETFRPARSRAHPRSRGENRSMPAAPSADHGSSPLTRGKLAEGVSLGTAWRLIPAHAGKTMRDALASVMPAAHPRSRGENAPSVSGCKAHHGSSPLTRGKLAVRRRCRAS